MTIHGPDDGDGTRPIPIIYCGKTRTWIECGVTMCTYRQTEEKPFELKPLPGTEVSRSIELM
jgi:hypothetical protein